MLFCTQFFVNGLLKVVFLAFLKAPNNLNEALMNSDFEPVIQFIIFKALRPAVLFGM
jgi:hypothetical protein